MHWGVFINGMVLLFTMLNRVCLCEAFIHSHQSFKTMQVTTLQLGKRLQWFFMRLFESMVMSAQELNTSCVWWNNLQRPFMPGKKWSFYTILAHFNVHLFWQALFQQFSNHKSLSKLTDNFKILAKALIATLEKYAIHFESSSKFSAILYISPY